MPLAEVRESRISLATHGGDGLLVLLMTTILSVCKPRGLTRYGQRKQHELRKLLMP